MSFLNGIVRSVLNPATLVQLAMGPAGWASLAMRTIGAQIGMEVIQQLGQRLGLPQGVIAAAQSMFANAAGLPNTAPVGIRSAVESLRNDFGLSFADAGRLERAANSDVRELIDSLTTDLARRPETRGAQGGKSWLMAIAENLGRTADRLAAEMDTMSQTLGGTSNAQSPGAPQGAEGGKDNKASDNLKFAAKSQEFSQFFSSANTVIKALGEALAQGARKQ